MSWLKELQLNTQLIEAQDDYKTADGFVTKYTELLNAIANKAILMHLNFAKTDLDHAKSNLSECYKATNSEDISNSLGAESENISKLIEDVKSARQYLTSEKRTWIGNREYAQSRINSIQRQLESLDSDEE